MQNLYQQQGRIGERGTAIIEDDEFLDIAGMKSEVGAPQSLREKFFHVEFKGVLLFVPHDPTSSHLRWQHKLAVLAGKLTAPGIASTRYGVQERKVI